MRINAPCPNIVHINTSVWFTLTSNMLNLSRFTVVLALASSILCVAIPAVPSRRSGELWAGAEHEEVDLAPSRRSGELWAGAEHEEVDLAPSRRSGELWLGAEHVEVDAADLASSRRSGELWDGLEHEEVSASTDV